MCMGGGKAAKKAAEEQTKAINKLAAAQKAKTIDMVSKTAGTVKTNTEAQNRAIASLRIPMQTNQLPTNNTSSYGFGLNIPM